MLQLKPNEISDTAFKYLEEHKRNRYKRLAINYLEWAQNNNIPVYLLGQVKILQGYNSFINNHKKSIHYTKKIISSIKLLLRHLEIECGLLIDSGFYNYKPQYRIALSDAMENLVVYKYLNSIDSFKKLKLSIKAMTLLVKSLANHLHKEPYQLKTVDFFQVPILRDLVSNYKDEEVKPLKAFYMYLSQFDEVPKNSYEKVCPILFPPKEKTSLPIHPLVKSYLDELQVEGFSELDTPRRNIAFFLKFTCKNQGLPDSEWVNIDIRTINKANVLVYYNHLVLKLANDHITFGTFKNLVIKLRSWLKYLYGRNLIKFNYRKILNFKDSKEKICVQILDDKTIISFFDSIEKYSKDKSRDLALFSLMLSTGSRPCEIARLKIIDYDSEGRTIMFTGKGGKTRINAIPELVANLLDKYLKKRPVPFSPDSADHLFLLKSGQKISRDYLNKLFKTTLAAANGCTNPDITVRVLRHTFATKLALKGVDPLLISEILGHASIDESAPYFQYQDYHIQKQHNKNFPLKED